MKAKRIIILLLILLIGLVSIFAATSSVVKGQFLLFHNVNVTNTYYFQFVDPSTGTEISSNKVELTGFGDHVRFVRLTLNYNHHITSTASVSFSDLTMKVETDNPNGTTTETTYALKYEMTVFRGSSSTEYSVVPVSENGAGNVALLSSQEYEETIGTKTVNLAEFSISINEEQNNNAPAGQYSGTITLTETTT